MLQQPPLGLGHQLVLPACGVVDCRCPSCYPLPPGPQDARALPGPYSGQHTQGAAARKGDKGGAAGEAGRPCPILVIALMLHDALSLSPLGPLLGVHCWEPVRL